MNITIIGTGNVGCTLAADLTHKGHHITLLRSSGSAHTENFKYIQNTGSFHVTDVNSTTFDVVFDRVLDREFKSAVSGAELIVFAIQTNYHEDVLSKIVPWLQDGQIILFEPGYLSTCYLLKHCQKKIISIEAESSPIDCRITEPGHSTVLFRNVLNPFGVFPLSEKNRAYQVLSSLGYPFRFTENVIEAALHNPNLIVHTVGALFSIPRIEYTKGEYWMYKEVFTPHIWTVCEALDKEKLAVLKGIGIPNSLRYVDACQERNYLNDPRTPIESFFDYALHSSPKGPFIPNSRYLTEDVSQGLVLLESIGKVLGIQTPISSSLITLASASLGQDFRLRGRTISAIGEDGIWMIKNDYSNSLLKEK